MAVELAFDAEARCAALARAGERVVPLRGILDEETFHAVIAAALSFPSYYGRNLDALWDCLTDQPPTTLVWWDWPVIAVRHARWWARLLGVLTDWADRPGCRLVLPVAAEI